MRILIAYDGSPCAQLAIEDLDKAGLPVSGVHAFVISVGEYFPMAAAVYPGVDIFIPSATMAESYQELTATARNQASTIADEAEEQLKLRFPHWEVSTLTPTESPASAILNAARDLRIDLIVMGSHGRSALSRIFLGSVSLRVVSEAPCSVRITKQQAREHRCTILLAFDGSDCSRAALREITHRVWPKDTHVHIVTAADLTLIGSVDYVFLSAQDFVPINGVGESHLEHVVHSVEHELKKKFSNVTSTIKGGSATKAILSEAELIEPDTIFMGAHGYSRFERLLLGSTAHGVSAHSPYTVEVIRKPQA